MTAGQFDGRCMECRVAAAQAVAGGLTRYLCPVHGLCDVPPDAPEDDAPECEHCGGVRTSGPPWCCDERKKDVLQRHAGAHPVISDPRRGGKS